MSPGEMLAGYRQIAADGKNLRGLSILQHKDEIRKLVKLHGASTLLDYGCGAGDAYRQPHHLHREWGLKWMQVTLFDPAFREHDEKPHGQFDGVLCSDVLEHIPEPLVDEFVANLFRHARKFVWASVCCRPAKKLFPNSETNLHVTIQPLQWWHDTFAGHAGTTHWHLVETP